MTPAPPVRARAPEIRALTGARGLPILLIALFHFHEWYGYPGVPWYDTIASKGYIWVEFFFVLSGFILFYAYGSRFGRELKGDAIGGFLAARVSRIYPLQVATLLAVVVLEIDRRLAGARRLGVSFFDVPVFLGRTAGTILSNLFMVQSWGFHDVISWNSPAWFVSVEFFLYLDISYQHGTWRGLADFGIGVALGSLFLARRSREAGGKTLPTRMHTLAQIGALAAVAAALCGSGPARTPRDLMLAVPIFALVFLLAFDRGLIARALHAPWLMKLGEWSFAIYMVHYIVMYVVASLIVRESFWLACLAGIVGSIAAGGLAWRFIERPVGEAMRRRLLSAWASRRSR